MKHASDIGIMKHRLERAVYEMRREAIETGDFEGWRLCRYARDASSLEQVQDAERRVARWWRRRY